MLDNQDFITPVAKTAKKEAENAVKLKSKREERHHKFVKVAYSTGPLSILPGDRPRTELFYKRTKKKAYSELLEEQAPEFRHEIKGRLVRRQVGTLRNKKKLHVPGIRVIQHVNDRFKATVNYENYRLLKYFYRYRDDVVQKLHKMTKKKEVQTKDHTF